MTFGVRIFFIMYLFVATICSVRGDADQKADILMRSADLSEMNLDLDNLYNGQIDQLTCEKEIKYGHFPEHCYNLSNVSVRISNLTGSKKISGFRQFLDQLCKNRTEHEPNLVKVRSHLNNRVLSRACKIDLIKRERVLLYKLHGRFAN